MFPNHMRSLKPLKQTYSEDQHNDLESHKCNKTNIMKEYMTKKSDK